MKIDKPTITDYTNATHNHSDNANGGTLTASSISDFDTEVSNNTTVASALQPGDIRELLTANRTYYVDSTGGSDSNNGLTTETPFQTIQKAVDIASGTLDLGNYSVTIDTYTAASASRTYSETVALNTYVGTGNITITGNSANQDSIIISGISGRADGYTIKDVQFTNTSGNLITKLNIGALTLQGCHFKGGSASMSGIVVNANNTVTLTASGTNNTKFSGSFRYVMNVTTGYVSLVLQTVDTSSLTSFTDFFRGIGVAFGYFFGATFTATAITGRQYNIVLNSAGSAASGLPGNTTGVTSTGGQFT